MSFWNRTSCTKCAFWGRIAILKTSATFWRDPLFDRADASAVVEPTFLLRLKECTTAVLEERKILLEVEPVYGASALLLAGSVEWLDCVKWDVAQFRQRARAAWRLPSARYTRPLDARGTCQAGPTPGHPRPRLLLCPLKSIHDGVEWCPSDTRPHHSRSTPRGDTTKWGVASDGLKRRHHSA